MLVWMDAIMWCSSGWAVGTKESKQHGDPTRVGIPLGASPAADLAESMYAR